jgi:hypothetical protein
MKPYLVRIAGTTLGTLALAFLLGSFGGYLDSLSGDEWATSQSLIDAQLSAHEQAKKDRAAAHACGNAEPIWIDETTVSCAQRKGPKYSGAVVLAGGSL